MEMFIKIPLSCDKDHCWTRETISPTFSHSNHTHIHTFINNSTCSQCQSYSRTGALTVAELHHRGSEENLTIHSERSRAEFSDVTAEVMRQEVLGRSGLEEINLEQSSSGLRVCVCVKKTNRTAFLSEISGLSWVLS